MPAIALNSDEDIYLDQYRRIGLVDGVQEVMQRLQLALTNLDVWIGQGLLQSGDIDLINETIKSRILEIEGVDSFDTTPKITLDRKTGILSWENLCVKLDCGSLGYLKAKKTS